MGLKRVLQGVVLLGLAALLASGACRQGRPDEGAPGVRSGPLHLDLAPL